MRRTNENYFKSLRGRGEFGGDLLKGNPRGRRPAERGQALHITFRSEIAKGSMRLSNHEQKILAALQKMSRRFRVTIYNFANAGNHLHLLLRPPKDRAHLAAFLRAFPGLVARIASGAQKGRPGKGRFFQKRPWSRLVSFGRDYLTVFKYVRRNNLIAIGLLETLELEGILLAWREKPA